MTKKRMETADDEFTDAAIDFIDRAHKDGKPFFTWVTTTRMHVWTHLSKEWEGKTGIGLYPDGMAEHDDDVGRILAKLKELGIDNNTIVFYSTDNGAETFTWPDGGTIPFHGEKGTTWEGGFRVPAFIKWPGVIKPGTKLNGIASHEDMIPTLLAAVGEPDIKEKLKKGLKINDKTYKVHLDGYNLLPWFKGEVEDSPRKEIMYFDQVGNLNAIRYNNWKAHFAILKGNIASAVREQPAWPKLINLRADPFERSWHESEMYLRWMAENMWIFVPAQVFTSQWLDETDPKQEKGEIIMKSVTLKTFTVVMWPCWPCAWQFRRHSPQRQTQHPCHLGRRCRDFQHFGLHEGTGGLPDAQHRQDRQ